jgi:nucleotide sugar dehydrogenase
MIFLLGVQMNNLSVIGIGRLGLCFSLTLEEAGYNVVGSDVRENYVQNINERTFNSAEPGVNEKLEKAKKFRATTSLKEAVEHSNLLFVTVASYSEPDGRYDVSQVDSVVGEIMQLGAQDETKHLVICTNVNPGYSDTVYRRLCDYNWEVSFNPETIAQGTILKNQKYPDCVYIGSETTKNAEQIKKIYDNTCGNKPSFHIMDRLSAELTKVSLNCFLTCKISFANMVGDLANKIGADADAVLAAVGSDTRINNKFFRHGFGWGGPCFPRDTRAYIRLSKENSMPHDMCSASMRINDSHLDFQVQQFLTSGKKEYYTDSVTYKPGTVILEESQQLEFAKKLAKNGIKVVIKESLPVVEELKERYGDLFFYE